MKEVTLVEFNTKNIVVDDIRNSIRLNRTELREPIFIGGTSEYIPEIVDIEHVNIEKVIDSGVEHYIAVSKKVFEYLYIIENPVTGKSLVSEIEELKKIKKQLIVNNETQRIEIRKLEAFKSRIYSMSFFGRLKFLFKGLTND